MCYNNMVRTALMRCIMKVRYFQSSLSTQINRILLAESKKVNIWQRVRRCKGLSISTLKWLFFPLSYNLDITLRRKNVIFQLHFSVLHVFSPSLLPQFLISVHKKNAVNSLGSPHWQHWSSCSWAKSTSQTAFLWGSPSLSDTAGLCIPQEKHAAIFYTLTRILKVNLFLCSRSHPLEPFIASNLWY